MLMSTQLLRQPRIWLLICCCIGLVLFIFAASSDVVSALPLPIQRKQISKRTHNEPGTSSDLLYDVSNSTLGFQKIFVIGLASRTDRRDSMSLAAAYTGLDIEYIDGVTAISDKALPPHDVETKVRNESIWAWRAHMNALRKIVEQNITSALILEDDVDWDIRIKSQMATFARASRLLVQPLSPTNESFLDPTIQQPITDQMYTDFRLEDHTVTAPSDSPYGDLNRWGLLWLGHCGCRFPRASDETAPLGRIVVSNDTTVPEQQHLNMELGTNELLTQYPAHTRVVSRARVNSCSLAYAVSQPGARRILYELAVHKFSDANDIMLRFVCDGVDDRRLATCLTVQPQLFQHHRPRGPRAGFSDIDKGDGGYNERATTANVRWSVRVNFPKLVEGETDYYDSYPDAEFNETEEGRDNDARN